MTFCKDDEAYEVYLLCEEAASAFSQQMNFFSSKVVLL